MEKYELTNENRFLKNGHTMFFEDVLTDLKRKSYLESNESKLKMFNDFYEWHKKKYVDIKRDDFEEWLNEKI